jgi:nanoRNase/pAp phosphatase (c-di-AMP/oligoRNAs hydrolase)
MIHDIVSILQNSAKKVVLLHPNADIDATGSAAALCINFKNIKIGAASRLKKNAEYLLDMLNIDVLYEPALTDFEYAIVVDTAHPKMLDKYQNFFNILKSIVIDHHIHTADWCAATYYYCDDSKTSCAEIIYELLKKCDRKICKRTGIALLNAILADCGMFKYATNNTLKNFCAILDDAEIDIKEIYKFIMPSEDISRRIAQLKGAQRLRYERINNWLVCTTKVGAFEANVAKALVQLGADIAFVGSQHKSEFRISARTSDGITADEFHLGKFFIALSRELHCYGGGHASAAGIRGEGDVEAILNICLQKIYDEKKEQSNLQDR